jgi:hypothetical protein
MNGRLVLLLLLASMGCRSGKRPSQVESSSIPAVRMSADAAPTSDQSDVVRFAEHETNIVDRLPRALAQEVLRVAERPTTMAPEDAWAHFRQIDPGHAQAMFEALAEEYSDRGVFPEAIQVYEALMQRAAETPGSPPAPNRPAQVSAGPSTMELLSIPDGRWTFSRGTKLSGPTDAGLPSLLLHYGCVAVGDARVDLGRPPGGSWTTTVEFRAECDRHHRLFLLAVGPKRERVLSDLPLYALQPIHSRCPVMLNPAPDERITLRVLAEGGLGCCCQTAITSIAMTRVERNSPNHWSLERCRWLEKAMHNAFILGTERELVKRLPR